ncbi:hypothetical protein COT51_04065 [candidate division WWE3 bacterium CG08_land_8_20_14_0_20_41_15]|uniref:Uncharacterized protein n=1 Tax=candidate division WWE3 bacterium CG08_land_8_20_14_0_20_41_15 TaxID=1975086 RepID=A0A2H0X8C9_UNCKA|nr:MAG: hypothetical protein COT51_04065 [candidate division WWE3 bacterium CG08_land_8_20_14_0_20_41_15]
MNIDSLTSINFIKIFAGVFLTAYVVFAFFVVRQIQLLIAVLKTSLAPFMFFISYLHLFASILVLVIALIAL